MPDQLARDRSATLVFYACVLLLGYLLYLIVRPFLIPLTWAAILAAFFFHRHKQIEKRFSKTVAASISTAAITLIIVVPFVLVAMAFAQQAAQAIGQFDIAAGSSKGVARVQQAWMWVQRQWFGQSLGSFEGLLKQAASWVTVVIANSAGVLLKNFLVLLADLVIMLFALFFFLRDGNAIMSRVRRLLPFDAGFRERIIGQASDLIDASLRAGLLVALAQGTAGALIFAVLGLGAPIFWGVIMAFFALLPLGAGVIWGPVSVWLLVTGQIGRSITLMVAGAVFIGLIDNVLRPILMSGRTRMNGLLVFISLLGGIAAFGLLGLVLGPVITAFTISFIEAYAIERRGSD